MKRRWSVSDDDGASWLPVHPINGYKHRITEEQDLEIGLFGFRKKLVAPLVFSAKNPEGTNDYAYFLAKEEDPTERCVTLYIRLEHLCSGEWSEYWRGKFSTGSGKWERGSCIFEVKPDTVDKYSCIMDQIKYTRNMIDVPATGCEAFIPTSISPIPFVRPYDEARLLYDVVEFLADETGCDYNQIVSDFFEWNPIGDAPGYTAGINYVTGATNQVDRLYIDAKSNTIDPTPPSDPATKAEISLEEMFKILMAMFQVYWDIDNDNNIRLEHWSFFDFPVGLDLPSMYGSGVVEPQTYVHLSERIPRIERYLWHDKSTGASSADFNGLDIIYSGPCVLTDAGTSLKETTVRVTTNLVEMLRGGAAQNINPDGFAIMATAPNSPSPDLTINDNGAITSSLRVNGPLAWANLHRDYFQHNRYLPTGNMNGADTTFISHRPNIEQENVTLTMCCDIDEFDASKKVVSTLAEALGIGHGYVQSVEHDLGANRTKLTLRYRY